MPGRTTIAVKPLWLLRVEPTILNFSEPCASVLTGAKEPEFAMSFSPASMPRKPRVAEEYFLTVTFEALLLEKALGLGDHLKRARRIDARGNHPVRLHGRGLDTRCDGERQEAGTAAR